MTVLDPVSGFTYPDEWVSRCDPGLLPEVISGLAVLTSGGKIRMRGFSTGTTAAAACKGAILSLVKHVDSVAITLPAGIVLDIPVAAGRGTASCTKYAGDYPEDATAGIEFRAVARPLSGPGIILEAGTGIGRFERDTPRYRKGDPAISQGALRIIHDAMEEAVYEAAIKGVSIAITAPCGEAVAAGTLNPRVGVVGGISVLGSTGLVEPWDDHLEETVIERVMNSPRVVLTTGRIGLRYSRMLFPGHEAVLVGSKIGPALEHADKEVVLCGLPGLILRYLEPDILKGSGCLTVEELSVSPEFSGRAKKAIGILRARYPHVRVVLLDRDGQVLLDSSENNPGEEE
ncbi:MAG: cobalt-precorrin-5B (C(1))-methyltransferase [Methanoregulaceae archaeon]|nr:cobalt-precorrin-5B (C(1))-methyltransferase [Methanoregulaceae archaeon]